MFLQDCGERDPAYLQELERRLIALALQAGRSLQPAYIEHGRGESAEGVHNRRTPGDVFDPEVGLLRVTRDDGSPIALVVNYACHPTTLFADNRLISADYPGLVTQLANIPALQTAKTNGWLQFARTNLQGGTNSTGIRLHGLNDQNAATQSVADQNAGSRSG